MKLADIVHEKTTKLNYGEHVEMHFSNGFGVSILPEPHSEAHREIAVVAYRGHVGSDGHVTHSPGMWPLFYGTPITADTSGGTLLWVPVEDVPEVVERVRSLKIVEES